MMLLMNQPLGNSPGPDARTGWGAFEPALTSPPAPWTTVPLTPGFSRLGAGVRLALRLLAVLTVAQLVLYAWGLSMFQDAAAEADYAKLSAYDDLDITTSVIGLALLVVAGISWMVWQYKLARSAQPYDLRRRPGWHAWAWITPVVGLWFPYQNVRDLWQRRFPGRGTAILGWWWAAYVISTLLDRIIVGAMDDADSIDTLETVVTVELTSTVVSLVALVLALRIHRSLSDAESWRFRPPVSPAASPAA